MKSAGKPADNRISLSHNCYRAVIKTSNGFSKTPPNKTKEEKNMDPIRQAVEQAVSQAEVEVKQCRGVDIDADGDGVKDGTIQFAYQTQQQFFRLFVAYVPFQNKGQSILLKGLEGKNLPQTTLLKALEKFSDEGATDYRGTPSCDEFPIYSVGLGNYDGDRGEDVRVVIGERTYLNANENQIESAVRDLLVSVRGGELCIRPR